MNMLEAVMASIKSRIAPFFNKIKLWLKPSYIQNRLLVKIRAGINKLFHIRPENEEDYYSFGRWLVGKKLAILLMVIIGAVSLYAILALKPSVSDAAAGQVKIYRYNSAPLKFAEGRVAILGKSGYLAYEGEVSNGAANGEGTLYAKSGEPVYRGSFADSKYNGEGKRYYPGNSLWYEGGFLDNQFEGEGKLYRENGTLEYEGDFAAGYKDGAGTLYDGAGKAVYQGNFQKDRILYEELLNRTTAEVAEAYTGQQTVYTSDKEYCVTMPDIGAMYRAHSGEETLDGEWTTDGIYVLSSSICLNGEVTDRISTVSQLLGAPSYEGNTAVTLPDAIAINECLAMGQRPVQLETIPLFEDCIQVERYDTSYLTYLYRFETEDYLYTFFSTEKNSGFHFYLLEGK